MKVLENVANNFSVKDDLSVAHSADDGTQFALDGKAQLIADARLACTTCALDKHDALRLFHVPLSNHRALQILDHDVKLGWLDIRNPSSRDGLKGRNRGK
jgi:hypothetical protein